MKVRGALRPSLFSGRYEEVMKTTISSLVVILLSAFLCHAMEGATNTVKHGVALSNAIVIADDQITANVESAEIRTVMIEIARQIPCSLYFDPDITNSTSISVSGQPLEKALFSILSGVSYVITWEPADDPQAASRYRAVNIRVFRSGNPDSAVLTYSAEAQPEPANPDLDALVAQGNAAISRLSMMLTNVTDAANAKLAAEALAKIGSPESVEALLDGLAQLQDGDLKEEICKLASVVSNKAAADSLLEIMTTAEDRSLVRASEYALAHMVDSEMLSRFAADFNSSQNDTANERLLNLVRNTASREAEEALTTLAGPVKEPEFTPLTTAALSGLSRLGTATGADNLFQRLESAPPDRSSDIFNAISQISGSDEARSVLQYAATGNKQTSSDRTRVAAIHALGNYPDGQTRDILHSLSSDASESVRQAATTVLQRLGTAD
jgi:HEAT repeat protein